MGLIYKDLATTHSGFLARNCYHRVMCMCMYVCMCMSVYVFVCVCVCVQVVSLLFLPPEGVGRQYLRVAAATVSAMVSQHPKLAHHYLIQPLTEPLTHISSDGEWTNCNKNCCNHIAQCVFVAV